MANNWFKFKQFLVRQDRCAMKVGTDGVILGAWANASDFSHALDVGTGTGLLALMLCQRFPGLHFDAIEIDSNAAEQARENAEASPFAGRVRVLNGDFESYRPEHIRYDFIVSNPPYFSEKVHSPDMARNMARNAGSLELSGLFKGMAQLLAVGGSFALIVPFSNREEVLQLAAGHDMHLNRRLLVIPAPGKEAKRICMQFSRTQGLAEDEQLIIETGGRHRYSDEYKALTAAFYLEKD